jgi:LPS export ABC transporter protein LptC
VRARDIVLIVGLAAAALGSWYVARMNKVDDTAEAPIDSVHRGYYLKSARILGTAPDGKLMYEIQADHAEQVSDDVIEFTDVNVRYSADLDVPWIMDADTATLQYDEQRVRLQGHVLARNRVGFGGTDTEIRTQYLELDPEQFLAETDQRVQIRIGERSLTATGMRASLNENRLQLKSNVSGKFVP